jgi:hypothetical protein
MAKWLSKETIMAIRKARVSGMSLLAIAVEFNLDVSTISRKCAGIPSGVRPGRSRGCDYARVAEMRSKGIGPGDLAERFGVSEVTIFKAVRTHRRETASCLEAAE